MEAVEDPETSGPADVVNDETQGEQTDLELEPTELGEAVG